jgi:hypothetical protein
MAEPPAPPPPPPPPEPEPEQFSRQENAAPEEPQIPSDGKWSGIVNAIKTENPGVGALLDNTENKIHGEAFYVIFQDEVLRDCAGKNPSLVSTLKKITGNLTPRFVTKDELDAKKTDEPDPLDELLAKRDILGDQMTIF